MTASFPGRKEPGKHLVNKIHLSDSTRIKISDTDLDICEIKVLETMRLVCLCYANPESQAWEAAFDHAGNAFGNQQGPIIAFSLIAVLRAIRESRKSNFRFSNPCCLCCRDELAESERRVIMIIHSMRRGQKGAITPEAMMLCEGRMMEELLSAIKELVLLLPAVECPLSERRTGFS